VRWGLAGGAVAAGIIACDGLWVGDTPRPTLKESDLFCVAPACPELVIDSNAIASVEPTVTITARRAETNLGAESVPVDVEIGRCSAPVDASASDAALVTEDAGEEEEEGGLGLGTLGPQCKHRKASEFCTAGLDVIDPATAAHFELLEDTGCKKPARGSTTQLNCTLDPSGQATFRVRSLGSSSPVLLADYLPICVRPATKSGAFHDTEVRVVPREGTARFAVAIADDDSALAASAGARCDSLVAECSKAVARARLRAGVISADLSQGSTRTNDFRALQRDLTIVVGLDPASPQAFLSSNAECTQPEGGEASTLSLAIERGQRQSALFFLCAPANAASYRVVATLFGTVTDAGSASASNSAVENRPKEVEAPSLVKGFSVDPSQRTLLATNCDGLTEPAKGTDFKTISPPQGGTNNTVVVESCEAGTSTDAAAQDAGDGGACSIELTLNSGDTSTL
jgi:hypothetical protein